MRTREFSFVAMWAFLVAADAHAGGFFRRIPEVGEWAKYDHTASFTSNIGTTAEHTDGFTGSLLVKCVGEDVVDGRRHLWIECRFEVVNSNVIEYWTVSKVLVPEEELLANGLSEEHVRGWQRSINESEAAELTDAEWGELSVVFGPDPVDPTVDADDRTLVVNEVEVQLNSTEAGRLPYREVGDDILTSDATCWPAEDLAFGVASVHFNLRSGSPMGAVNMHGYLTYDLAATGTDAVSELPDHN